MKEYNSLIFLLYLIVNLVSLIKTNFNIIDEGKEEKLATLRFSLDEKNLGEIEEIIVSKILKTQDIYIDSFNLTEEVPIIGKLDLSLNNMIFKITNDTNAELFISFLEKNNINFIVNLLYGELTFDYMFNSSLLSSKGNSTVYLNNISLALNNTIIQVPNKHEPYKKGPGIKIESIGINDFEMEFDFSSYGTFEKFINFFNLNLKNILIGIIERQINNENNLQKINDELLNIFKNMTLSIPLEIPDIFNSSDKVNLSFSMNTEPYIKNNQIEVSFEAELLSDNYVYDEINNITLPYLINSSLIDKNEINGIISEFLFNNVLDIINYYGKLNFVITNDTIGIAELNLGVISAIIPEITNGYKASQKAKIITSTNESPIIKVKDENKAIVYVYEDVKFFAYPNDTINKEEEGTIPVDSYTQLEIEINFYIKDDDIELSVKSMSMISFVVNKSLVGDIDTARVIKNFNSLSSLMLTNINNKIKEVISKIEIPIKIYDIDLTNLNAQTKENYIKVSFSPLLAHIMKVLLN